MVHGRGEAELINKVIMVHGRGEAESINKVVIVHESLAPRFVNSFFILWKKLHSAKGMTETTIRMEAFSFR
jgi:hypothetical protein